MSWIGICRRGFAGTLPAAPGARLPAEVRQWRLRLEHAGVPEAALAVQHLWQASAQPLCAHIPQTTTWADRSARFDHLCGLRLQRWPVQYLVGDWDFCELTLAMRPPVLIPRPETEVLAMLMRSHLRATGASSILELGCGTGAISLALLHGCPGLHATVVDINPVAVELTRENAASTGLSDRITIVHGDLATVAVPGQFDAVVSNPPYVTTAEMADLQPEIAWHEDRRALDGGADGLDLARTIIARAREWLCRRGSLWLELAPQHPAAVARMDLATHCLRYVATHSDWAGLPRFCQLEASDAEE
eukprot:m.29617 g.29617  ORF g.29617 m.29617 type:complete len:304 (-) comp4681_c0_seq2:200-1111(-)